MDRHLPGNIFNTTLTPGYDSMSSIRLLAVGKLKTPHFKAAAAHYAQRIARSFTFEESIAKDADAALGIAERKNLEGERLLKLLRPADCLLCLDEKGTMQSSADFARFVRSLHDKGQVPAFVVGGAYGLSDALLERADSGGKILSLGPMTFPHELARVLLLEQIYRAGQIIANTGYHH